MRRLIFFITGFVPALLVAQSGSLDPAFGNGGVYISDDLDQVGKATLQTDGKILVAGGRSGDIGVARYDPNGLLDQGFGESGVATKDISEGPVGVAEVAVQSDGKILVVGTTTISPSRIVMVRFDPNGDMDPAFGSDGEVITNVGGSCYASGLALHVDGRIVVVGSAVASGGSYSDIAIVSYLPDGTLDDTFSGDGKVITPFSSYTDIAYDVAIDVDDRILVTGYGGSTNMDLFLARYLPDGTLDNAFAGDGIAGTAMPGTEEVGSSIAIRSDGRVLVGGTSYTDPDSSRFILFGFLENGAWDPDLGSNGVVYTDIAAGTGHCTSILLQPDGRIVAGGWCGAYQNRDFALARYGADGSLDSDFGANGIVVTDLTGPDDQGRSLMLQSSGRIILSGSQSDVEMAAYLSGLIIGVADPTRNNPEALVYPNPLGNKATFEYEIMGAVRLTCDLIDSQGRTVQRFFKNRSTPPGLHSETLDLSGHAPGQHTLVLRSDEGEMSLLVVKE